MSNNKPSGPRSVAIIGPYLSGKTTLLENILYITGSVTRKGSVTEGNTVGDSSPEARARNMSVEVNTATTTFMDDEFTFLDCPGSIEFLQEAYNALIGVDAAVVVCEPDAARINALQPLLKVLDDNSIPRFIFINKIDKASGSVSDLLEALQSVSSNPVVLRQIPIVNDGIIQGYVDLALERTYLYKEAGPSELIDLPPQMAEEKTQARFAMMEQIADFDDHLMEELLEDIEPERDEVFGGLTKTLQEGAITSVLLGAAEHENGVRRLLKALRHEVPGQDVAAARVGATSGETVAQVLKTYQTQQGSGKLSLARIWSGSVKDGASLNGHRVAGLFKMLGHNTTKIAEAGPGEVVALGRMEDVHTGEVLTSGDTPPALPKAQQLEPVYALAVHAANRNDEVKLSTALAKLVEEDPALMITHDQELQQMLIWGQGDIHLKVGLDRLNSKYGLEVTTDRPRVPYKEAIKKSVTQQSRFKRQTGGHGQFGDVTVDIKPLPRGSGFQFEDNIVGGVIPKQFIPAVEAGVRENLSHGPLGFPVVDVAVRLHDGKHHAVDSSEMAFKTAGRMAMTEGLPKCSPVLLEPIMHVDVYAPSEYTASINALISGRRGQILGFDAREGWPGWDQVSANMPQSEIHDLIIELRSLTQGVGTFSFNFDHLQELTGRLADQVLQAHAAE